MIDTTNKLNANIMTSVWNVVISLTLFLKGSESPPGRPYCHLHYIIYHHLCVSSKECWRKRELRVGSICIRLDRKA